MRGIFNPISSCIFSLTTLLVRKTLTEGYCRVLELACVMYCEQGERICGEERNGDYRVRVAMRPHHSVYRP